MPRVPPNPACAAEEYVRDQSDADCGRNNRLNRESLRGPSARA